MMVKSLLSILIIFRMLMLQNVFASGSDCSSYDFPCENGECIDAALWCDSTKDCSDGSDEKYCKKSSWANSNPNRCPKEYFKCKDGPCIPTSGRCNGYPDCSDSSDEANCESEYSTERASAMASVSTVNDYSTTIATLQSSNSKIEGLNAKLFFDSLNETENSVSLEQFSGLQYSALSKQKNMARNWILSQRSSDFGWGDETPRALTALYLSDIEQTLKTSPNDMLMVKQLEMQISLELAKNETKPMKWTDLSLNINALHLSCKNPRNFYGDDLVNILREGVNVAQRKEEFISPSIYLNLCLNNATTLNDMRKLQEVFSNKNDSSSRIDTQALALLATSCIFRKTNFLNESMYDTIKKEFLRNLKVHGFPGNVYEAALLFQALQEMKVTLAGSIDFIHKQQQSDGSFGDILSTYLVLPTLAGKNLVHMYDYCSVPNTPDLIPLEVLKNVKRRKMHVHYSLYYGVPTEVKQTLDIHVAEAVNILSIMRLAQEINPQYRFSLNKHRKASVVYSISGMPNDAEKGMYWTLYTASGNKDEYVNGTHWVPYFGDIKKLILKDGDKILFWYRPL